MLAAFVLAAAAASPPPMPAPPLSQLKTIITLRATPMCAALHERVGPAIADVMDSDAKIASGRPMFGTMYQDDVVLHSDLRMSMDVMRMENLITPIAKNISAVKSKLDGLPKDPDLDAVRAQMQHVIDTQNDALNVLSGFVATYQLGDLMGQEPPGGSGAPAAKTLLSAGVSRAPSERTAAQERIESVNLGSSPYHDFAAQMGEIRKEQDAAELAASQVILSAVDRCTVEPSTP